MSTHPRLILNDDGTNFPYMWDDLGMADLRVYLERLKGTQVDQVAYCASPVGMMTYYPSEVGEQIGTGFAVGEDVRNLRYARNLARLEREGGYLQGVFDILREVGIAPLASFRMNDAHMSDDGLGPVAPRFWLNHPQWRLGEPYGYYASCLDYAVPGVRESLRLLIAEVVGKFPQIAGVELDGLRSPFFFKDGLGEANAPVMTGLIRQIRADLDAAAKANRAERYLLRVNVPRTPELALRVGMDVAAWEAEGLVDAVSPGTYDTDFAPATAAWKALLKTTPVEPYLNCSPATGEYLSLEEYRGAAANAWATGADGIYLFNFPCLDELCFQLPKDPTLPGFPPPQFHGNDRYSSIERTRKALGEIGDPQMIAHCDKRFLFAMEKGHYYHQTRQVVSLQRLTEETMALGWDCYEDFAAASQIKLEFKLVAVNLFDEFAFEINGQTLPSERIKRLHASNGRDTRFRSRPLTAYGLYTVALEAEELQCGTNVLGVMLVKRDPALLGAIDLMEMAVTVSYCKEACP